VPGVVGLKVVRIDETGVEFQLNGKTWKQSVSSPAATAR
jgi:hypothetical protein